jgi:hypothetical protein
MYMRDLLIVLQHPNLHLDVLAAHNPAEDEATLQFLHP